MFNSEIDFPRCHQTDKKSLICNLFWENCSLIKIWISEILITFLQQNEAKQNEVSETGTKALSEEEVRSRIEEYNAQVSENGMKLVRWSFL